MHSQQEVIIIGSGPSGLAAAKVLRDAKIDVTILEKGGKSGSKNFYSSVINKEAYENVFGSFVSSGRFISEYRAYLLTEDSSIFINAQAKEKNNFSILRESLNDWLTKTIETSGAKILYENVVTELIVKDGKVCGVKCEDIEYFANVVIIAEGANSILTKNAGLRAGDPSQDEMFLFVEENISLPSEIIEERFNLQKGFGTATKLFTSSFFGIPSIAYMHTNKDSISLSTGVLLSESIKSRININEYQEKLKKHPNIKLLIADGTVKNYSSYMLPVLSLEKNVTVFPKFYTHGCLVTGSAAMLVNLFNWDLSTLAIISGKTAAETIIRAKELGDYSAKTLCYYEKALEETTEYKAENNLSILLTGKDSDTSVLNNLSAVVMKGNYEGSK